jgi:hypothetical protein
LQVANCSYSYGPLGYCFMLRHFTFAMEFADSLQKAIKALGERTIKVTERYKDPNGM